MIAEAAAQAAALAFKREAVERLKRHEPANALMLLDGLERFFDNGDFWLHKNDGADGNRCLVGGIEEARRVYKLSDSQPAHYYLIRVGTGRIWTPGGATPAFHSLRRIPGNSRTLRR